MPQDLRREHLVAKGRTNGEAKALSEKHIISYHLTQTLQLLPSSPWLAGTPVAFACDSILCGLITDGCPRVDGRGGGIPLSMNEVTGHTNKATTFQLSIVLPPVSHTRRCYLAQLSLIEIRRKCKLTVPQGHRVSPPPETQCLL